MKVLRWCRLQWDRALALTAAALGAVALLIGWHGASTTGFPAEQLPYLLSGGLGSLFLLGIAGTLWVSADLRDEWRKLDRFEERLDVMAERLDALNGSKKDRVPSR